MRIKRAMQCIRKRTPADIVLWGLLVIAVALSVYTSWHTSAVLLDGDSSSELVLAEHLNKTGRILSSDWIYSTELRVLNTQLVYSPLFSLTGDWHTVRFLGMLILQGILAASWLFLCRSAGFQRRAALAGSAMLLLPVSVAYGRIVLYHTYYIPHIAISFTLFALMLRFARNVRSRKIRTAADIVLLVILSILSGMGGIRQAAITHAPVLAALCFSAVAKGRKKEKISWELRVLAALLISLAAFFIGYAVNTKMGSVYQFEDYSATRINWYQDRFFQIVYFLLHTVGLRQEADLMSAAGVLSVASIPVAVALVMLTCRPYGEADRQDHDEDEETEASINAWNLIRLVFPCGLLIIAFEMMAVADVNYVLYVLPYTVWMIPLLAGSIRKKEPFWRRMVAGAVLLVFLGNGVVNAQFFIDPNQNPQRYEGLSYNRADTVEALSPLAEILAEEHFDIGYSTFWNCNVITELTNGSQKMIQVKIRSDGIVIYNDWLTLPEYREVKPESAFILVETGSIQAFEDGEICKLCTELYRDPEGRFAAWKLDDPDLLYRLLTVYERY